MILSKDSLQIVIGSTIFRSHNHVNPQFVFDDTAVEGFLDGVSIKRSETERSNQWGDFKETGLFTARHLSLTGMAVANNAAQLMQMRDEFTGLLNDGLYQEIKVTTSGQTRYLTVALEGSPSFVKKLDNAAIWKLDLYAPDPRLYGEVQTAQVNDTSISGGVDYSFDYPLDYGGSIESQTVSLTNAGNTDAWPIFIVRGDYFYGFSITNNAGREINYKGIVSMSDPVTINTADGTATQGGIDKSTQLTKRDWFSIPAGQSIQPMFIPTQDAAGWCDIIYRDTWI